MLCKKKDIMKTIMSSPSQRSTELNSDSEVPSCSLPEVTGVTAEQRRAFALRPGPFPTTPGSPVAWQLSHAKVKSTNLCHWVWIKKKKNPPARDCSMQILCCQRNRDGLGHSDHPDPQGQAICGSSGRRPAAPGGGGLLNAARSTCWFLCPPAPGERRFDLPSCPEKPNLI